MTLKWSRSGFFTTECPDYPNFLLGPAHLDFHESDLCKIIGDHDGHRSNIVLPPCKRYESDAKQGPRSVLLRFSGRNSFAYLSIRDFLMRLSWRAVRAYWFPFGGRRIIQLRYGTTMRCAFSLSTPYSLSSATFSVRPRSEATSGRGVQRF